MTDESQNQEPEVQQPQFFGEQQRQWIVDSEQLKMLSIAYWVLGATHVFAALYGLVYVAMGVFYGVMSTPATHGSDAPPEFFSWFFGAFGMLFLLGFGTLATLQILSGFWIRQRKHRTAVLVTAGISTLSVPFGTLIGIFTFIALLRPSVTALFGAPPSPYPSAEGQRNSGCGVLIAVGLVVLMLTLCGISGLVLLAGTTGYFSDGGSTSTKTVVEEESEYEYPPQDPDVWDEDMAEKSPPPDEPKSGKPDAGTSTSDDGRWTVKLYWLSQDTDPARLQVDLEDKKEKIKFRAFIDVPSADTAPREKNGDLEVDWEEIDDEYMQGLSVGGQSLYLDEMFRVYK